MNLIAALWAKLLSWLALLSAECTFPTMPLEDKWPPISEDEFVRRCSPGVDPQRALKARRIIANHLGLEYDRIYPEQSFVEDLGI